MSKSIASLFKKSGSQLGLDDQSSEILVQNLNASVMPLCVGSPFTAEEGETDDFRIIEFVLDCSGSMEGVEQELRAAFNDVVIPGLLGGAADQVGAIRIGGLKFNGQVSRLWQGGFLPVTQLPPLTAKEYKTSGSTALHKAVLDAVTDMTGFALQIAQKTGTNPECVLVCMSDGANNMPPDDTDGVFQVLSKLSPELVTTVFIGFETFENVDFRAVARALGFRDIAHSKADPGETKDDQRRRFRHLMKVFSGSLVSRTSSSMAGSKPAANGSTGFWTN